MDVAIIAAMDEEMATLRGKLEAAEAAAGPGADLPIYQGRMQELDIVIVRCGIGKVNAALAAQYTIDHFKPKAILTSGVAGALSPLVGVGDIIIATGAQQHDFDARGFGYARGVIPRLPVSLFPCDPRLVELAVEAAEHAGDLRVHQGLVVSGDLFVSSPQQKQEILEFFPEALCADMETASIAQVAALNNVPFLSIQTISDAADEQAAQSFYQTLDDVLAQLNSVVEKLLEALKGRF
ncbi:MAG TPA: 5'-methylthioadenosine/adenosylhomocysteine nucleosidase [Limnochordia bacterium]|nr:5'-methylthioadenosine/adenosylhomocysteine nucleosidase [Limnochordia bacterium]